MDTKLIRGGDMDRLKERHDCKGEKEKKGRKKKHFSNNKQDSTPKALITDQNEYPFHCRNKTQQHF